MKNLIKTSLTFAFMAITLAWSSNVKASTTVSALQIKYVHVFQSQQISGGYIVYGRVYSSETSSGQAVSLPTSESNTDDYPHDLTFIGKYNGTYWDWINDNSYSGGISDFGVDGNGDVYTCGSVRVDEEDVDILIVKLSGSDGSILWEKQEGTKGVDRANDLFIDANDKIYVGGVYSYKKGKSYYPAAYVSKWTSSGKKRWSEVYDAGNDHAICSGITSDASGNVYITGDYAGKLDIGKTRLSGQSNYNTFVAKINKKGAAQWAESVECDKKGISWGSLIAADANGNVYVSGGYGRDFADQTITKDPTKIDFGNHITLSYSSSAGSHYYITQYNSSGTAKWAKKITGSNITPLGSMFISSNNNLFMLCNVNASGDYSIAGTSYTAASSTFLITELNTSGTVTIIQPKAVNYLNIVSISLSPISGGFIVSVGGWYDVDLDDYTNISDNSENYGFIATYTDALFKRSPVIKEKVIKEKENEITGIKVYPNPANDILFIESSTETMDVSLTDLTGKVIINTVLSDGKAQIDLNEVKPGIYFLKAGSEITKILKN